MKLYIKSATDIYTTLKHKINDSVTTSDIEKVEDAIMDAYKKDEIAKGERTELMRLLNEALWEIQWGYQNEWEDEEILYRPSVTNRDFSPSSPWNAPGMSVRDFI